MVQSYHTLHLTGYMKNYNALWTFSMKKRWSWCFYFAGTDMPGDQCIVCGITKYKDKSVFLHRFPRKEPKRGRWLEALELTEEYLKDFHRVCSKHFPDGDDTKDSQLNLGKRFASPKKRWTTRAKQAVKQSRLFSHGPESDSSSHSVTPGPVSGKESGEAKPESATVMVANS